MYGKSVLQFVHPDYRNIALKRMQKVLMNEENLALEEEKFITAKGNIRTVEVVAVPIQIENKISSQVVFRDITDRKLAEQEIERLATVVEQAVDSIIITDINGKIKYVNHAFEKVTGFKKKEILGQNPKMFKSGKHGREFYNDLWNTIKSGKKWQGVIINKKKNKNIFYERAVIFPLKNENGKIINFAGIMRDITLERKLEDQLQQIQKMEAIGTLSGGVAHDFNNILTVINGHAEIAMMNLDESRSIYNDLLSILNAGKRAERLTSQLLAFSRKQIHELKVLNINQTIKELDKMLRRLIPEDIEIISDFSEDLPFIKADPSQIEQIIFNLVINARDAITDEREKVTDKKIYIQTRLVDLDNVFVDMHPGSRTGPHILLSVKDTGKGMEIDVKNRIFEPFFTTKEVDKGTGLGLATVYGIVKQNDGSIYVESNPGEGSRFDIYWPVTTESPATEYIEKINQKELSGQESILFVEDDEGVRQFACTALKSFGYTIIEAQNGKNALQLTKKEELKIDLIITDLIMPEMNGHELVKQVISFKPDLKVIYVSGYTFEHLLKDGEVDESINFLQKPYTIQSLLKKIKEALND
jgi:PAS domain S-box-containing protein